MPTENGDFRMGVEEEYQIVDPATRELLSRAQRVVESARERLGEQVHHELYLSQVEIGTAVCPSLDDARGQLTRLRKQVITAAESNGTRIAAGGTHPFSHWGDQTLTPKQRYRRLAETYQHVAKEQVTFGCHVHVGIVDRDLAIETMNRARAWLPPLLALAANSPFWVGRDSGYASYRSEIWRRWPTAGPPQPFASRADYDALIETLVATGSIRDATKIYWDIRPSARFETLEFRVTDVCMTIDEAVMVAGLTRALARTCADQARRGQAVPTVRPEVLDAARWRASRYGIAADLIDVHAERAIPAAEMIDKLLGFVHDALEDEGDWDEVSSLVSQTHARGNGAMRQRRAFERSGRIEDVVDLILEETALEVA